jgi:hypothetical protein
VQGLTAGLNRSLCSLGPAKAGPLTKRYTLKERPMIEQELEGKSEFNIRLLKNSAKWMSIFAAICIGAIYLFWLFWSLNHDATFIKIFYEHLAAVVGVPGAIIAAFVLVNVLEQVSGPIEFEGLGFKFKGASGTVVLWVLVFLSIISGIKILW